MRLLKSQLTTTTPAFPLLAELTLSPVVATNGGSDFSATRRFAFAFEAAYCDSFPTGHQDTDYAATSLGFGDIDPERSDLVFARNADRFKNRHNLSLTSETQTTQRLSFSRNSLLQLILRNPQDGCVSDIFVVKLELGDMPPNTRTILRQKSYRTVPDGGKYLAKLLEIPLVRSYDSDAKRQRIRLAGPIRAAFSFNRSNLRYTSSRRADATTVEPPQKTLTILEFPSNPKYYAEHGSWREKRSESVGSDADSTRRFFQHGSLCL